MSGTLAFGCFQADTASTTVREWNARATVSRIARPSTDVRRDG